MCVCASPERKLIEFDTLHVPCCTDKLLLFAWLNLIEPSAIKQPLNKQRAVLKKKWLCAGSAVVLPNDWVNSFHFAAPAYSFVFVQPEVLQMSIRFWINNQKTQSGSNVSSVFGAAYQKETYKHVRGFPASVFLIGMLELNFVCSCAFFLKPEGSVFQITSSLFEGTHSKRRIMACWKNPYFWTLARLWLFSYIACSYETRILCEIPLELCSLQSVFSVLGTWRDEILMSQVYPDFGRSLFLFIYLFVYCRTCICISEQKFSFGCASARGKVAHAGFESDLQNILLPPRKTWHRRGGGGQTHKCIPKVFARTRHLHSRLGRRDDSEAAVGEILSL